AAPAAAAPEGAAPRRARARPAVPRREARSSAPPPEEPPAGVSRAQVVRDPALPAANRLVPLRDPPAPRQVQRSPPPAVLPRASDDVPSGSPTPSGWP